MKNCYLDSNVLIYFKTEDVKQHPLAVNCLNRLLKSQTNLYLSPLVLDEFLYVVFYLLKKDTGLQSFALLKKFLNDILMIPRLTILNPPADNTSQLKIISLMQKYSLKPRDAYHLLIMQTNHIDSFATFDTDFTKVFRSKTLHPAIS